MVKSRIHRLEDIGKSPRAHAGYGPVQDGKFCRRSADKIWLTAKSDSEDSVLLAREQTRQERHGALGNGVEDAARRSRRIERDSGDDRIVPRSELEDIHLFSVLGNV